MQEQSDIPVFGALTESTCEEGKWYCPKPVCRTVEKICDLFVDECLCCEMLRHWAFGFVLFSVIIGVIYVVLRQFL